MSSNAHRPVLHLRFFETLMARFEILSCRKEEVSTTFGVNIDELLHDGWKLNLGDVIVSRWMTLSQLGCIVLGSYKAPSEAKEFFKVTVLLCERPAIHPVDRIGTVHV